MRVVSSICALLLFAGPGVLLLMHAFPMDDGGSSKTRAVKAVVHGAVDRFGETEAALGFIVVGIVAAAVFYYFGGGSEAEA